MSTVQPIAPPVAPISVLLANNSAPSKPQTPTNVELMCTVPGQPISDFGAIQDLPAGIIMSITSQQAVINNNLSKAEKVQNGIINGATGLTVQQANLPGQLLKPGSAEFISNLWAANPNLPFNRVASSALMTGYGGVTTSSDLQQNTTAQLNSVVNATKQATAALVNSGVISGKEQPTQIAGIVMAAAVVGSNSVIPLLKNPQGIPSLVGNTASKIGKMISSGNYASGIADAKMNGVDGVATSLGATMTGNNTVTPKFSGILQNAFSSVEQSFGQLKAGTVNMLGSSGTVPVTSISTTLQTSIENQTAREELVAADRELLRAKQLYADEETVENYNALRTAEAKVASAQAKVYRAENNLERQKSDLKSSLLSTTSGVGLLQSTIQVPPISASAILPTTTANSGINSLPGGINTFVNQIGAGAKNILSNVKNIIGGIKDAVSAGGLNIASGGATLVDKVKSKVSGFAGSIYGAINSLGNAPGQIKTATLATNTDAKEKAVINATLNSVLDPKVPPPVFGEKVPEIMVSKYQEAQVNAQTAISELFATREIIAYKFDQLVEKYEQTGQTILIDQMDSVRNELAEIDIRIAAAQLVYERIISSQ